MPLKQKNLSRAEVQKKPTTVTQEDLDNGGLVPPIPVSYALLYTF